MNDNLISQGFCVVLLSYQKTLILFLCSIYKKTILYTILNICCVCVCVCIYVCIYIYIYIYIYIHTHTIFLSMTIYMTIYIYIVIYIVMDKNIGTLGKYDQRRL